MTSGPKARSVLVPVARIDRQPWTSIPGRKGVFLSRGATGLAAMSWSLPPGYREPSWLVPTRQAIVSGPRSRQEGRSLGRAILRAALARRPRPAAERGPAHHTSTWHSPPGTVREPGLRRRRVHPPLCGSSGADACQGQPLAVRLVPGGRSGCCCGAAVALTSSSIDCCAIISLIAIAHRQRRTPSS
jgi:hypothetical protein